MFRFLGSYIAVKETTMHGPCLIGLSGNQKLQISLLSYKNAIVLLLHLEVLRQASLMLTAPLSLFLIPVFSCCGKVLFCGFSWSLYKNDFVLFICTPLNDKFKALLAFSNPKSD